MSAAARWRLFEVVGVELEYMLVEAQGLEVLPVCDQVLAAVAGRIESEVVLGPISWSNELALHVIEFKTTEPARELAPLVERFNAHVRRATEIARGLGGRLLPGAMHPWMDPLRETRLWPHEHSPVYEAFDRIFGCQGHGWANLQSAHLNLPFVGDDEFGRLHAAIRLLLPLLPALAASSPVADGRVTGWLDTRLEVYRHNCRRIPTVTGSVIPEPVFDEAGYRRTIFEPMWSDIAAHDPQGVLRDEFLNARGAIARFGRGSIEIRVLDVQECVSADLAIAALVIAVLKSLASERHATRAELERWPVAPLAGLLEATVRAGDEAVIEDSAFLQVFGWRQGSCPAGRLWRHLFEQAVAVGDMPEALQAPLVHMLDRGPLARRLLRALDGDLSRPRLVDTYRRLADCLEHDELLA